MWKSHEITPSKIIQVVDLPVGGSNHDEDLLSLPVGGAAPLSSHGGAPVGLTDQEQW